MKVKKIMLIVGLALGLMTLMSTECQTGDPVEPDCDGFATATTSGNITSDFCFDVLITYDYVPNESVVFTARQEGDPEYAFSIIINPFNGAGTYNCGSEDPGFVELILHGSENEFYKSKSGSVVVTQVDETHFKATFNVVTVGYYNEETVNFSGTADK